MNTPALDATPGKAGNFRPRLLRLVQAALGLNAASILRELRFRDGGILDTAVASYYEARPLELTAIPVRSLEEILKGRRPRLSFTLDDFEMKAEPRESGALPVRQLLVLLAILAAEAPAAALEIGTFFGQTALAMAQTVPHALIHTVDLPLDYDPEQDGADAKDDFHLIARRRVGQAFVNTPEAVRIRQHYGDTMTWDFSPASGATFFFIDGGHTYDACRNDSERCLELCGGKGTFLWHDCDILHPGVVRLLREWRDGGRDVVRVAGTPLAYWKGA